MIAISKKAILIFSMIFGLALRGVASASLQDVNYNFDQQKLSTAKDAFHFLRSYVDYYYLIVKANRSSLPSLSSTWGVPGWCVGDAHPENFGVLLQNNGASLFSMNDIDDSGPCPVVLDIFRLMVSSRLYDNSTKIDKILVAYLAGIQRQNYNMPPAVQDMMKKSQKKGTRPSDNKVSGNKLIRDSSMREVTADEAKQIKQALVYLRPYVDPHTKLLDMLATVKVGGGSGGLLRYEILLNNKGSLVHLEFKEEVTPAIYPVALGAIPDPANRVMTTLKLSQSSNISIYYNVVQINNMSMMVRPRFDGNVGVALDKQSASDNRDIILYEAYQLGVIHSRSVKNINSWVQTLQPVQGETWENDVDAVTDLFANKFKQLKAKNQ